MKSQRSSNVFDLIRLYKKYTRRLRRLQSRDEAQSGLNRKRQFLQRRIEGLARTLNPLGSVRRAAALAAISATIFASGELQAQTPVVIDLDPATNANQVATNAEIEISFSTPMNVSTMTEGNIRIFGSQRGFLSADGSFSGSPNRSFDPDENFNAGERIFVTVTGATSLGGTQMTRALVYCFRAESYGSGAAAFAASTFGGRTSFDVEVGDLDGDGNLDAVFADSYGRAVWLGNGDGTFSSSLAGSGVISGHGFGDLDADGDLDVIVAGFNFNEIWLNNGDATFLISSFGSGNNKDAAIGDLDGDGDLDAILPGAAGGSGAPNSIWLNNGDGTFASSSFGTGNSSKADLGDIDGDGDLDAVIANYDQGASIWLNNGDGSFTSNAFGSARSQDVALGDLDGDGDLDAVVAHYGQAQKIWIGDGTGSFSSSTFGHNQGEAVDLGDLDGDGDLDAIVGHTFGAATRIWINNGDATFTSTSIGAGSSFGVAIGDLDNDGDLDAIIANASAQANDILINTTIPVITTRIPAPNTTAAVRSEDITIVFSEKLSNASYTKANFRAYGTQTGDLTLGASLNSQNDNQLIDIAPAEDFKAGERIFVTVTNATNITGLAMTSAVVWSFRAAVDAGCAEFNTSSFGAGTNFDVEVGDLDGDGDLDAILAENYGSRVWLGNGDGTFTSSKFGGSIASGIGMGDLDGDGDLDAVIAGFNSHQIWLNNGDATFTSSAFGSGNGKDAAIADMDGDGDLDVVLTAAAGGAGAANFIWFNNGDATFSSASFGSGNSSKADIGDIDGDGDFDVLITNYNSGVSVFFNDGSGSFPSSGSFGTDRAQDVALGDLDGDGDLDAVIARYGRPQLRAINDGSGSFALTTFGSNQGEAVDLGDLDADGDLDIIVGHTFSSAQGLWLNNGDGTFASQPQIGGGSTFGVAMGDVDNDGDLDAIMANALNQADEIWLNQQAPQVTAYSPVCVLTSSTAQTVTICGYDLAVTNAQVQLLDSGGIPAGSVTLATSQLSSQKLDLTLPAGAISTAGSLTLSFATPKGTTTALIDVFPGVSISGTTGNCSNEILTYQAVPSTSGASIVWSITGGTIQSGQGTEQVEVLWSVGTSGSVTVNRTYAGGCETSASYSAGTVTQIQATADTANSTEGTVTTNVLANDLGPGLTIVSVDTPSDGTVSYAGSEIVYTPFPGFSGVDSFDYTVENSAGCQATTSLSVTVVNVSCPEVNIYYVEREKDRSAGVRGLRDVQSVAVSPDGKHVYAGGRRDHSIAIFERNQSDGTMTYLRRVRLGSGGVRGIKYITDLAVSSDGSRVYATGFSENALAIFDRNSSTGSLTFVERKRRGQMDGGKTISGLKRPRALALSPDGSDIYVTGFSDNSVSHFTVSSSNANVSYVATFKDGAAGVDGMRQPLGLAVSPDGKQVFVAGSGEDALAVFDRNTGDGTLTYSTRFRDGILGVDGLADAIDVAVSPDGAQVYVAGFGDNAVARFDRNAGSGVLTFIERYLNGSGGIVGMNNPNSVVSSPDGCHVWVASASENSVVLLDRDLDDGELSFRERVKDGVGGFDGLRGVTEVALAPKSDYAYSAGARDNAVASLYRNRIPVAEADVAAPVGAGLTSIISVLNNDLDYDGHSLTISAKTDGTLGTATISGGGTTVSYDAGVTGGADQFTYTIDDGFGGSSTATVNIMIQPNKLGLAGSQAQSAATATQLWVQLAPNPVEDAAVIQFELAAKSGVRINLTDINGRHISSISDQVFEDGAHSIDWPTHMENGAELPVGVYLLTVEATDAKSGTVTRQLIRVNVIR